MEKIALILILLSVVGIAASWGVAVYEGTLAEEALGAVSIPRRAQIIIWPFASKGRMNPANAHGRRAGKAQIVLIASVMVAVAATSVYTNLTHERPAKAASAAGTAPSQS